MPFKIPVFDVNNTIGALEVGALVTIFLFGVVTLQVYFYFSRFPDDSWYIKLLVGFVWYIVSNILLLIHHDSQRLLDRILDLGHSIALCHYLYTVTVTQYGKPSLLLVPAQSVDVAILLGGLIGPIEQGWFIRRLYVFSGNLFLTTICTLLSLVRVTGTVALAAIALEQPPINEFTEDWRWLILLVLITGAVTDLILASTLWYYLMQWKRKADKNMSRILNRLSLVAVGPSSASSARDTATSATRGNTNSRIGVALTTEGNEGIEMRVPSRNHQYQYRHHRMARVMFDNLEEGTAPIQHWKAGSPDD
ncbi:hypothetical protein WG66_016711 [Moniliophthora roreri]|nr:hypothetical protein WG66_016711 [Moniliophthora roreri]